MLVQRKRKQLSLKVTPVGRTVGLTLAALSLKNRVNIEPCSLEKARRSGHQQRLSRRRWAQVIFQTQFVCSHFTLRWRSSFGLCTEVVSAEQQTGPTSSRRNTRWSGEERFTSECTSWPGPDLGLLLWISMEKLISTLTIPQQKGGSVVSSISIFTS